MIANDQQLQTTLGRIGCFQNQVAQLRKTETNPVNYRAAVSGFLAEIDGMQLETRAYRSSGRCEKEPQKISHGADKLTFKQSPRPRSA